MKDLLPLFARISLAGIFLLSGFGKKIAAFSATRLRLYMIAHDMPYATVRFCFAIVVEIIGGFFHGSRFSFESRNNRAPAFPQYRNACFPRPYFGSFTEIFLSKNLAIMAGLLMLVSRGSETTIVDGQ